MRQAHRHQLYRLEPQGEFFGGRGTFSVRWNAEGDNPPVDVKHGDGRFNYYNTNLYLLFRSAPLLLFSRRDFTGIPQVTGTET